MIKSLKILFFTVFFACYSSYAQEIPLIHTFTPEKYKAENQNWAISQNTDKYIYFANNKGLLEYNGEDWQLYSTPNETIMRSVKCYKDMVFSGFYMDFGYWKKNSFGNLRFTSIVKENRLNMLEDEQIWEIFELDGWMIFKSLQRIYLYNINDKEIKIINATNSFVKLSKVENRIYYQDLGKGIFIIENGTSKLVTDNELLKNNRVVQIFQDEEALCFITQKNGFYYFENNSVRKWSTSFESLLTSKTIYSAQRIRDGSFLLGTISSGLFMVSATGELIYHLTQEQGLHNNTVLSIFEDIDHNIWLGLDNGINAINLQAPFKQFVKKDSFWGTIYATLLYKGFLYIGTNQGLYYKKYNTKNNFSLIQKTEGQVWGLQIIDDTVFCNHDSGTFIVSDDKAKLIKGTLGTWQLKQIKKNTILSGNYDGLYILEKENSNWILKNKLDGFSNSSRYFVFADKNKIFVNHEYKGVFKLNVDQQFKNITKVVKDTILDKGIHSSLIRYKDKILYASKKGVYTYDDSKDSFKKDSIFSQLISEDVFLSAKLIHDKVKDKLWSFAKGEIRYLTPGKFSNIPDLEIIPLNESLFKGASGFENILHLKDQEYLIGTTRGYLVIDLNLIKDPLDFYISINKVLNNQTDATQLPVDFSRSQEFNSTNNSFQFFYSVPNYNKGSIVKYSYKLNGLNTKWSPLSESNTFLFENLTPNNYTFKVRAFIDGKFSKNIASFSFKILKPWYLSTPLLILYGCLILVGLFIFHLFSKRYYKKQREELIEKAKMELELKELESNQKIIKLNNDKLRADIDSKNRELATSTMSIIKKNEFLNTIKKELTINGNSGISKVITIIDKNLNNTDDWRMFQEAFNNADKKFLKKMKSKHVDLTPNDLRLCAYLRLNLSSKEIAPLLNISPRSVEVKRYRLRKKINLPHDVNLTNYILEI